MAAMKKKPACAAGTGAVLNPALASVLFMVLVAGLAVLVGLAGPALGWLVELVELVRVPSLQFCSL